ncbi:hypothetical protein [Chitinophaga alhagiae]|uniref:hypothetical protein n=1 Tax=Chitinophaga alhagiae TaxID=2203219 RepID=UPI0013001FC6|nr:hypothetical protein [Chitinophaga alhagiae]
MAKPPANAFLDASINDLVQRTMIANPATQQVLPGSPRRWHLPYDGLLFFIRESEEG